MNEIPFVPEYIYIKQSLNNKFVINNFTNKFKGSHVTYFNDIKELNISLDSLTKDSVADCKKRLVLTDDKILNFKVCPCNIGTLCCDYYVLNMMENCPIDCSYCFLQSYLTNDYIKVNINHDQIINELDNRFSRINGYIRLGTGELSDSLVFDDLTFFSSDFIPFVSKYPNVIFEFKTKTNNIKNILEMTHGDNIVIGWSLNPQSIININESRSSSLINRLEAAYSCIEKGYKVAFHFDPLIFMKDWKDEYYDIIKNVFKHIDGNKIAWISIGSLRFPTELKEIALKRFKTTDIFFNEFFRTNDNKFRYLFHIRLDLYQFMVNTIKDFYKESKIYLCMEEEIVWKEVFNISEINSHILSEYLVEAFKS